MLHYATKTASTGSGEESIATIEIYDHTKRTIAFAAQMANVSEAEIIERLVLASSIAGPPKSDGLPVYADYGGHRTRGRYFAPGRVEIIDGPLAGKSYKSPTGAARAVVRQYSPEVNDNRNGWMFWQLEDGSGGRVWLQSIRPSNLD